jgi:hypothetical protein
MKRLSRPNFAARATLESCIASIDAGPLKIRLGEIVDQVEAAETEYLRRAAETTLFAIAETANVGGYVTCEEMKRIYRGTFVKSVKTRHFYDAIKKLPENDICPLCSQRTVSTLDHYLAQTRHPTLAVVPANLVPACGECNKKKLDLQPATGIEQTFHPYFDDFDDERWLHAAVEETIPARALFRVSPPAAWSNQKKDRAMSHFSAFGLGALYASHSAVELTNIRHLLSRLAKSGTSATIRISSESLLIALFKPTETLGKLQPTTRLATPIGSATVGLLRFNLC